jgi:hypothetical protein
MLFGFSILFVLMCFNVYVYIVYDLQFMITFEFNDVYTCALHRGISDVPMIFRHIHPSIVHTRLRAVSRTLLSLIPKPRWTYIPTYTSLYPPTQLVWTSK